MQVTDEMLAVYRTAYYSAEPQWDGTDRHPERDPVRKGLEAALAAMPQPVAWRWRWADKDEWRWADSDPTETMEKIASVVVQPLFTTPAQGAPQPSEEDDMRAAREAAAVCADEDGSALHASMIRTGHRDHMSAVRSAFLALRTERQRGKA